MESTNPVFNAKTIEKLRELSGTETQFMTVNGTINKTGILILLTILSSAYSWSSAAMGSGLILIPIGLVVSLIACIAIIFKKEWSQYLAPAYAIAEGLMIGAVSYYFNVRYHGIVFNAMVMTFGTLVGMLGLLCRL